MTSCYFSFSRVKSKISTIGQANCQLHKNIMRNPSFRHPFEKFPPFVSGGLNVRYRLCRDVAFITPERDCNYVGQLGKSTCHFWYTGGGKLRS